MQLHRSQPEVTNGKTDGEDGVWQTFIRWRYTVKKIDNLTYIYIYIYLYNSYNIKEDVCVYIYIYQDIILYTNMYDYSIV